CAATPPTRKSSSRLAACATASISRAALSVAVGVDLLALNWCWLHTGPQIEEAFAAPSKPLVAAQVRERLCWWVLVLDDWFKRRAFANQISGGEPHLAAHFIILHSPRSRFR